MEKSITGAPIAYKFVKWSVPALDNLAESKAYKLRQKLNKGERLDRAEKNWLTQNVNHNAYFKNAIPLQGYCFNFSDTLRTFVVNQYNHYQEYKAVDKTSLRAMLYGKINQIIEVK